MRFIAEECEQLAPQALQLAVHLLTQTRDVILYQNTVQDYNSRPGTRDVIPQDTEWVETMSARNLKEKDKLETELKTYTSNMIKESIRVRSEYTYCFRSPILKLTAVPPTLDGTSRTW